MLSKPDPGLLNHVRDVYPTPDALDALEQAGEMAAAMLASPGWRMLAELLQREIATIERDLERIQESRAHYAQSHGRLGGLRAAEGFLNALVFCAVSQIEQQRAKHEGVAESASGR